MMEKVVSEGGGKTARIKGYRIAGKTGTAQKIAEQGGYAPGKYIASFVGFVPADKPQYAMLVMLDTPRGAFYGSQVSAPIPGIRAYFPRHPAADPGGQGHTAQQQRRPAQL